MPDNGGILVSPLDWGLGHAARIIPVVKALLHHGQPVVLAASGPQAALLSEAFPGLPILSIPGYGIRYGRGNSFLKTAAQVPEILGAIRREHAWLREVVKKNHIKAIISDNRYGLWHPGIPGVIITHQLQVELPLLLGGLRGALRRQVYRWIQPFGECWVPDFADGPAALSGTLGHPAVLPGIPVHYIGWLTRFGSLGTALPYSTHNHRYKAVVVLSGPEPQRTILEQIVLKQAENTSDALVVLRGMPGSTTLPKVPAHLTLFNHLPSHDFEGLLRQSEFLISRGGYSTLMDAFTLGMRCIFVPTPGQTEQEYLCREMQRKGQALCFGQKNFNLQHALQRAAQHEYNLPGVPHGHSLNAFIEGWLHRGGLMH